ncbi:Uncharacterised protein [Escherichia coli]|uniref:Uncharacterized protein n=1 Tax=Escherichia coli TaxID=562 RepID=A0A376YJW2_ECOLX|nr:Uncharacterised protein [Escherichia coli]
MNRKYYLNPRKRAVRAAYSVYEISLDIRNYCTFNAPSLMLMYAYISINNEGKE